ncbi:hypothetical protein KNE206_45010 [Kitasatospora sp. NE20-6]|uniref:hypothetical protein n=1 Tax=Kitasatospora sp. NE20-6 TaxID=2859066 RepID=UPI0034DC29F8
MTTDQTTATVADDLRARTSAFVNHHVDLWVAVEEPDTLVLAGNDPAAVFRAASDWLADDPAYTVLDVRWDRQAAEPVHALRLVLRRGTRAVVPAPDTPRD